MLHILHKHIKSIYKDIFTYVVYEILNSGAQLFLYLKTVIYLDFRKILSDVVLYYIMHYSENKMEFLIKKILNGKITFYHRQGASGAQVVILVFLRYNLQLSNVKLCIVEFLAKVAYVRWTLLFMLLCGNLHKCYS